jgi:hypothetical protein
MRFNVPPGWPSYYQDGDRVDPSWPAAPDGWVWWSPLPAAANPGPETLSREARAVGWVIVGFGALAAVGGLMLCYPADPSLEATVTLLPSVVNAVLVVSGLLAVAAGLVRVFGRGPSRWQGAAPVCSFIVAMPIGVLGFFGATGAMSTGLGSEGGDGWATLLWLGGGFFCCLGGMGLLIASLVDLNSDRC